MTTAKTPFDLLRADPAAHFNTPAEILASSYLDRDQKLDLLKAWELDETRLQEAASENMSGGEADRLSAVRNAIIDLKENDEA